MTPASLLASLIDALVAAPAHLRLHLALHYLKVWSICILHCFFLCSNLIYHFIIFCSIQTLGEQNLDGLLLLLLERSIRTQLQHIKAKAAQGDAMDVDGDKGSAAAGENSSDVLVFVDFARSVCQRLGTFKFKLQSMKSD
jgi:hypothetical protein